MECPDCGKILRSNAKSCSCGWIAPSFNKPFGKKKRQTTCHERGCPLPGSRSFDIGEHATMYCSYHSGAQDESTRKLITSRIQKCMPMIKFYVSLAHTNSVTTGELMQYPGRPDGKFDQYEDENPNEYRTRLRDALRGVILNGIQSPARDDETGGFGQKTLSGALLRVGYSPSRAGEDEGDEKGAQPIPTHQSDHPEA